MVALLLLVLSIAAVDSLNPSTVGPALLLAANRHGQRDVAAFAAGVFAASAAGGIVLVTGPGQALLAGVSRPGRHTLHLIELVTGAGLLAAAAALWTVRQRLARRMLGRGRIGGRSSLFLGAAIMAVELPTAFPYFGALAAIVASRRPLPTQLALVAAYNVVFAAPLALVLALLFAAGPRRVTAAAAVRDKLERYGPVAGPIALALLGAVVLAVGERGLAG